MAKKEENSEDAPRIGRNGNRLKVVKKGDPSLNPKGRPPKLLKHLNAELKQKGYEPVTPSQVMEAYELLLNLPREEIKKINANESNPWFLRVVAREILDKRNSEQAVKDVTNRVMGKPKVQVDLTSLGEKIVPDKFEGVTLSQLEQEFEARGLPKPIIDTL